VNASSRLLGGRYEIGELLGRGGMAEVHLGRDTRLGRTVAVKMLRSDLARDPSFQARFRREAQSAAGLNHPTVVAVYDSGEEPDADSGVAAPYIVMEYVEGRTLRELLTRGQRMPWQEALRMTDGVLAALSYSHRAGLVHRDIKPANVMVTPTGEVKVMDFGIARAMADSSATMTQTQAVIGTAQYLSPEQARGETVDARSDLYSTGCLLYELVTGRPPFVADSPVAVAYQHVGEEPTPPSRHAPDVPESVDAIVLHALVKDRSARYQSADEFRDDVEAALAGRRISSAALGPAGLGAGAATTVLGASPLAGHADAATTSLITMPAETDGLGLLPEGDRLDERPRRTGLWVLLGLVSAALLAAAVLVLPGLLDNKKDPTPVTQVVVPDLAGKTVSQAARLLRSRGLELGDQSKKPSDTMDKDLIISFEPPSTTRVNPGTKVNVVLSTGPQAVKVPDLSGKSQEEAKQALEDVGLKLGEVTEVDTDPENAGKVVASSPAADESVAPGSQVAVEVASGKVLVPNVVGLPLGDAYKKLTDLGFNVDASQFEPSAESPDGQVLRQSIDGDKVVKYGSKIQLTIAKTTPTPSPTTPEPTPTETPVP
jgi:eukaryotic-like serine/threonine-protein kinase